MTERPTPGGTGQTATIVAYNGATEVATVQTNWASQPFSGTTYTITSPGGGTTTFSTAMSGTGQAAAPTTTTSPP